MQSKNAVRQRVLKGFMEISNNESSILKALVLDPEVVFILVKIRKTDFRAKPKMDKRPGLPAK